MGFLTETQPQRLSPQIQAPPFVELMAQSHFSFLEGASSPEDMVHTAAQLGYGGLCLMDTNGFYGSVRAHREVHFKKHFETDSTDYSQFRYLVGCLLTPEHQSPLGVIPIHLEAYRHLSRLVTNAKMTSPKGEISLSTKDVLNNLEDCFLFPCPPFEQKFTEDLVQRYGTDLVLLPLSEHATWESRRQSALAQRLAGHLGIEVFVTQRPLMHRTDQKKVLDVVHCLKHKIKLNEADSILQQNAERHLHVLSDLFETWRHKPQAWSNTLKVANQVEFSLSQLRYQYPRKKMKTGESPSDHLRSLIEKKLPDRFPSGTPEAVAVQIQKELKIIDELKCEDYFLTLSDICDFARRQNILFQGRGSAANSVVCYVLGLTAVNPLEVDLLFERFLSKERGEPPDIDIDFEHERREEVIQFIYQSYGLDKASMVCTVIRFRSRMSIREVGKVLGVPLPKINQLIRFMGRDGFKRVLDRPDLCSDLDIDENLFQTWIDVALQIHGFPRHLGIHTGGFVLADLPICEICPTERASMNDRYVIQWNKDDLATLGLMKVDILSLGMLTAVRKCFQSLQEHGHGHFELYSLPPDDSATYAMIQRADTVGVFQIESRAQMSSLPRSKPKCFYDLVTQVAIIRPGPLQGGMVHPYLKRKQGREPVEYPHPDLVPILKKTMGVPIFQEQVMRIASTVAGFSPGESNELRRIMSSAAKRPEQMTHLKRRLINGMLNHGISAHYAERVYQVIEGFSSYGFPESHAASFALITYASCYLKCHHPAHFLAAILNSQPMGFYSPRTLLEEAQRFGVQIWPLNLNFSEWDYTVHRSDTCSTGEAIRVGLKALSRVHESEIKKLLTERQLGGPFADLNDFIKRTQLQKNTLLQLAAAGLFDPFGVSARSAMWILLGLDRNQNSLCYLQDTLSDANFEVPSEGVWSTLHRHYKSMGFSTFYHPIGLIREDLEAYNEHLIANRWVPYFSAKDLIPQNNGQKLRLVGILSTHQRPPTAKGTCFLTLEDEFGLFNVIVPKDVYETYRSVIYSSAILEVRGLFEVRDNVKNIKALSLHNFQHNKVPEAGSLSL